MSDRRITRSISNEYQNRLATQAQFSNPQHHAYHNHNNNYTRGLSGLLNEAETSMKDPHNIVIRNTSEEMFIKSLVEGLPAPNMEGIGFTNLPQTMRADSEELFHSWMSHGEGQSAGHFQGPHRSRQSSRRMSNELSSLLSQQSNQNFNRVDSFDQFLQTNIFFSEDAVGEKKARDKEREKGEYTAELSPLKSISWFSQSRPMTRSCSSELRRRYAAMQGQSPPPTDHMHEVKQTSAIMEDTSISLGNGRFSQPPFFPQVNHASLPPFHNSLLGEGESVSNFVTLLKGTLERKKMGNGHRQQHQQQQWVSESCPPQRFYEDLQNRMDGSQNQVSSALQLGGLGQMQHEGYGQVRTTGQIQSEGQPPQIDGVISGNNQSQPGLLSHAPSPSESSAGAPVLSAGEDPCNSGQTTSLKRAAQHNMDADQQPKRQNSIVSHPNIGNGETIKDGVQIGDISKNPHLTRVGSITSSGGGSGFVLDKEDPTKKRRVERQRKMAEAKGRSAVPIMPSDLQATLKRCDALEKEVRSLKLNLSFMNRKDSEQTKQIEELQKQNEDLQQEKEKLLEEIEQLTSGAHLA